MEDALRGRLILILSILTLIFFIGTIGSCSNTIKMKTSRDKEMATRLDLEEKMNKVGQDRTALETKLNNAMQSLEEEKVAHQATKKALLQEQLVNQSLKEEIQKITKLKDALEEDLKDALIAAKTAGKTKR